MLDCIKNNASSKYVKSIHLFVDNASCLQILKDYLGKLHSKIKYVGIGKQPKYSNLFYFGNYLNNEICMVTNSDIWIKEIKDFSIFDKLKSNNGKTAFALSRHEHDMSCPMIDNFCGSHDAFIFKSPISQNLIDSCDHHQNLLGAENVVCFELHRLGYELHNPAKNIIIVHEHKSQVRTYDENIRLNLSLWKKNGEKFQTYRWMQNTNDFNTLYRNHFAYPK